MSPTVITLTALAVLTAKPLLRVQGLNKWFRALRLKHLKQTVEWNLERSVRAGALPRRQSLDTCQRRRLGPVLGHTCTLCSATTLMF